MLLSAEDKNNEKVQSELIKLWNEVFGDEKAYAKLILPFLSHFDCYAVSEEGEIVSAMYLLPCFIDISGKTYKGKYLYAAATKEESRNNGYMSLLINEAVENNKNVIDFISLVPADEGLYSYYGRFGFEAVMENYETDLRCIADKDNLIFVGDNAEKINSVRKECFTRFHYYDEKTMEYALECYHFFGTDYFGVNNSLVMFADDERTVYEVLEKGDYTELLKQNLGGEIKVISSEKINESSKKMKCGMVLSFSEELKKEKEIYMNLTLM